MDNLNIYNQLREVPEDAKKKIPGGRLSGMTDIKPMWRIEKLTEVFGPCGLGWKTVIKNKQIIDGANDEKIAIVDIDLFVKFKDVWSEAIEGTGGSSFISKEKNGLYTNDECFKMAYTDALSVACKSLGMGADVYWGDSKYDTGKKDATLEEAKNWVFGEKYKKHAGEKLEDVIKSDAQYVQWYLQKCANEFDVKCYELLTGEIPLTDEQLDERFDLITEMHQLELDTDTDHDKILEHFKVDSENLLTNAQLNEAIKTLEKKQERQLLKEALTEDYVSHELNKEE